MANPVSPASSPLSALSPRSYGGETHEQRVQKRHDQFIAAGKHLFGTVGYRRTTVRGLCKEAGLTDRYFYESFATIEDLLVAVYETLVGDMQLAIVGALAQAEADQDPGVWIDRGLDAFFAAVEDAEAARIVWLEVLGVSPAVDAVYLRTLKQFADMVLALVREAFPNWAVDADIAPVVAMGLIGAASESAKNWMMSGYSVPRSNMVRGVSVILRGATLLAVAPPPPP